MGIDRKQVRSAAQKQVRKGNWKKAIPKYEELVDDDPEDVRSRLKLADLYTRVGREEDAVATYREAGDHHAEQDIYQKAVAVYKQAIRLEPEDPELHRKVGEAYHRLDRLKDAAQAFKRAQQYYKEAGEQEQQLEILEELVRLDPEDVGLRIQLAETYAKREKDDQALGMFREAAEMLAEEGHQDEYVQVAERILYFDPDDHDVRKRAIQIYIDQGDNKRALKHLQICFNANSRDARTLRQLAETFLRLDRTEKAALVFQKLASTYCDAGELEQARRTWQRILDVDPTNETAQRALRKFGEPEAEADAPAAGSERERAESGDIPTISEDSERTTSGTLDEIEFIDEETESGPQTPKPREGVSAGDEVGSSGERVTAASDSGSQTAADARDRAAPGAERPAEASASSELEGTPPGGPDEPPSPEEDESARERAPTNNSLETPVDREELERSAPNPGLGETSSTGSDDELDELLNEADVFLKYGLYDKAREVIHKILEHAPNSIAAYEKRRRLYAALDEPRAEAATLVDMARMSSEQPPKARHFLRKALDVGGADRQVRKAADDLGIDLPGEAAEDHRDRPPRETQPSIDVPEDSSPGFDEAATSAEATPIDGDHDFDDLSLDRGADREGSDSVVELDDADVELIDDADTSAPSFPERDSEESGVSEVFESVDLEESSEPSESGSDALDPARSQPPEKNTQDSPGGEREEESSSLGFTETEVEGALDDLFEEVDEEAEDDSGTSPDDGRDELDAIDSLIERGSLEDAETALDSFAETHPNHPGVEKRRDQLESARRRGQFERKPTGARSLSGQFKPNDLDAEPGPESIESEVVNTNLEVGTAYREMGMHDEALDEFRQALEDPDAAPTAKYNIALCKAEKGKVEQATEVLSRLASNGNVSSELRSAAREKLDDLDSADR